MKEGIIIYQSKYGATEKYAKWLKEDTGFDCIETKKADIGEIVNYKTIILGGGIYASGIAGLSFIKKNFDKLKEKKVAVFCVGASPYDETALEQVIEHNFKKEFKEIPCFYCRGAWDEEKMTFKDRTLCKMLAKAVSKKSPEEYESWEESLMCAMGEKCDWTDREYLLPIIKFIKEQDC